MGKIADRIEKERSARAMKGTCQTRYYYSGLHTECHRNPPTVFVMPNADGKICSVGMFPPMNKNAWCGEYLSDQADGRPAANETNGTARVPVLLTPNA